jgi:hypothetical protein
MATYLVANGHIAGEYGFGNAVAVVLLFFISLATALAYQRFVLRLLGITLAWWPSPSASALDSRRHVKPGSTGGSEPPPLR